MGEEWIGSIVLLQCRDSQGTYQGEIQGISTEQQTMTLTRAFWNGTPCSSPQIIVSGLDIISLEMLQPADEVIKSRTASTNVSASNGNGVHQDIGRIQINGNSRRDEVAESPVNQRGQKGRPQRAHSTPRKLSESGGGRNRNLDCFSTSCDDPILQTEFDFQKNLALFDKDAVFDAIDMQHGADTGSKRREARRQLVYRPTENIIDAPPVTMRQIAVPQTAPGKEFTTDNGLVVPSISYSFYTRLLELCESCGLTSDRTIEAIGIGACQMVMQVMGGANRLTPKNSHQKPVVTVLCGPHRQGAQGVATARHLTNRGVDVTVFVPKYMKLDPVIEKELKLYLVTNGFITSSINDLLSAPVDLIINTLDCHNNALTVDQPWYSVAAEWATNNKAPVLTVEPPHIAHSRQIDSKWTLALGLPLDVTTTGRLFLCDMGIPEKIFEKVGITYASPFGHKYIVGLHPLKAGTQ